jgi:nucleotide-binding universal stress UspA family protein
MLRSVMVPVDFTDECSLVLRFAEGLSALGVKRVVLGHVVEASGAEGPVIARSVDRARERIQAMASGLADAGLQVETRIGTGDAARELVALATEAHVDAVIAGSHGKSLLTKLISGSVSEQIAVESNAPTMLVRYNLLKTRDVPGSFATDFGKQVILGTDFSASSTRALMAVLELPKGSVNMLYIVHSIDPSLAGDKLRRTREGAEFQMANMRKMAEDAGVPARCVLREQEPRRAILQEANERRVTGIIVGSRGQSPLREALVGSVSMTLIRQASCPVMIVP